MQEKLANYTKMYWQRTASPLNEDYILPRRTVQDRVMNKQCVKRGEKVKHEEEEGFGNNMIVVA